MSTKWRTCCACGPFKPKWMKMVDNIYKSPNGSSHHSKLLQFCVRKPDKLDRIASYLCKCLGYYLNHNNDVNVNWSVEAINSLMNVCHQRLSLFVVHYLKIVQLLLESTKPEHQLQGCNSFLQFSQLKEDTESYHKEYEYLIQHFSKLAHCNTSNQAERDKLRISGIKGIKGVVRKCTMDQLQVNVIDSRCLNMIIPALLFNMKIPDTNLVTRQLETSPAISSSVTQVANSNVNVSSTNSTSKSNSNSAMNPSSTAITEETPASEAALAFREIVIRASFNIQPVITSIFTYLDNNKLWDPPEFTLYVIEIFLDNIKNTQAAYTLMKQLVNHLSNDDNQFTPLERTGIVKAINKTVISLAAQAVGPDIFHNFKSLLQILRKSIESTSANMLQGDLPNITITQPTENSVATTTTTAHTTADPEKQFQEAIITTIAEFAKNLPDTQKIEIMKFILNFDSMCSDKANRSRQLVRVLLKTMLQVATQYKTGSIAIIFNSDFLNLLLNGVAVDRDPGNRIFVQKILHTLIDRHDNTAKLNNIKILESKELFDTFTVDKPSRQDLIFMKKNGSAIIDNLFLQMIDSTNKVNNLENIYCTLCLISFEMGAEQVIVDLYRLMFGIQEFVLESHSKPGGNQIPITHQCALHAMVASFMNILTLIADLPQIANHISQVVNQRVFKAKYYLPSAAFNRSNTANSIDSYPNQIALDENLFFSKSFVREKLNAKNFDTTNFDVPFKLKPGPSNASHYMSQGEIQGDIRLLSQSMTSLSISESASTILEDEDQAAMLQDFNQDEDLSFDAIKKLLEEPSEERTKRRLAEEIETNKYFREVGFEKICKDQKEKYQPVRQHLQDILNSTAISNQHRRHSVKSGHNDNTHKTNNNPATVTSPNQVAPHTLVITNTNTSLNFYDIGTGAKEPNHVDHSPPDIYHIEFPELFIA